MLGVLAAPGAPETLAKGGGRSPPPVGSVSGAPGATQTPKMIDFRPLNNLKFPPKVQPRYSRVYAGAAGTRINAGNRDTPGYVTSSRTT